MGDFTLKYKVSIPYVIPKPRYGLPKDSGHNPNPAILAYFGTFTGICAQQTAINYHINLNKCYVKNQLILM